MLELRSINKEYNAGAEGVRALRGVDINFRKNEFVSILGPSGCGKTTLLNIIGGLDRYTSGDLVINGRSTKDYRDGDWDVYRNRSIGFVFQSYNLIPHQSVLSNVELALTLSGVSKSERRKRATEALERVGLGDQLKKRPSQMSGGQMQRVAIARALVNNPDILLADEPTGALDTVTSEQVMQLLSEVAKDRLVIMVTHNPELAERYSTRIISLRDGLVVADTMPYDPAEGKSKERIDVFAPIKAKEKKVKKKPMSHLTALSLSKNNLMTKKGRTFLTSFAGSIGIIGIALILALSNGINNYINAVQKDTLSSYPIQLMAEEMDMSSVLAAMMESSELKADRELDRVYANTVMYELFTSLGSTEKKQNNLAAFKKFIESSEEFKKYASAVSYTYNTPMFIYADTQFGIKQVEPSNIMEKAMEEVMGGSGSVGSSSGTMSSMASTLGGNSIQIWSELIPASDGGQINQMLYDQYDLVYGQWPSDKCDIVLILNQNNEVSDLSLYALGLKDSDKISDVFNDLASGEADKSYGEESYSYEQICALTFKLLLPDDYYVYDASSKTYTDMRDNETFRAFAVKDESTGLSLRVCGIIRPNPDATSTALSGTVGYTSALTEYVINETNNSEVVRAQKENTKTDVVTGLNFNDGSLDSMSDAQKAALFIEYVESLSEEEKAQLYVEIMSVPSAEMLSQSVATILSQYPDADSKREALIQMYSQQGDVSDKILDMIRNLSDEQADEQMKKVAEQMALEMYKARVEQQLSGLSTAEKVAGLTQMISAADDAKKAELWSLHVPSVFSDLSYDERLDALGVVDLDSPAAINIYASTFEDKDSLSNLITNYNENAAEDDKISYTDYVALIMSGISTIINVISYVLIAFVSISLVVSSIMIGIITYISVLERTKEIGILRAIGASKGDISRVFNAETLIVGFISGFIGIATTLLLCIPVNAVIQYLSGISNIAAELPAVAAAILVCISMFLTFIAGLVPSKIAAKKDPVVALRSE